MDEEQLAWFRQLPVSVQTALLNGPAMKPPEGKFSNFNNPPNKSGLGYAVLGTSASLATILVACQLYTRILYSRKVTLEDYVAVGALCSFVVFVYFTWILLDSPGLFVHQWNVRLKDLPHILHSISAASTVYGIVIMLLKVAILLHWTHMFVPSHTRNSFWWTCHALISVNVIFYVICTFIEIFACSPREKLWKPWVDGRCLGPKVYITPAIAAAFVNFFSDIVILLLPHRVIWTLRVSTAKKCAAASLFLIGIFATVCAGIRIKATFDFADEVDMVYSISSLAMWCIAEMIAGFLVLCLPMIPRLVRSWSWFSRLINAFGSRQGGAAHHLPEVLPESASAPGLDAGTSNISSLALSRMTSQSRYDTSEAHPKQAPTQETISS